MSSLIVVPDVVVPDPFEDQGFRLKAAWGALDGATTCGEGIVSRSYTESRVLNLLDGT